MTDSFNSAKTTDLEREDKLLELGKSTCLGWEDDRMDCLNSAS